ncbi:MAG: carboxypeptidase-like regulatory domain-containing protein, partial [Ignavibacteriales bacterium]|nr:carboxypeptidase-like regulatory domain-containing protein [Ignavibacteriales bacterium]
MKTQSIKNSFLILGIFISLLCCIEKPEDLITGAGITTGFGGRVFDHQGNPLIGVSLTTEPTTRSVITDSKGNYTFKGIKSGNYTLKCSPENYVPISEEITVTEKEFTIVNLQTVIKGIVTGKITDQTTGAAVEGVTITTSPESIITATDEQGIYRLEYVTAGEYTVKANKSEYVEITKAVKVENGKTKTQNIVMVTTWGNVTGKVTDETTGLAVTGATITTTPATKTVTTDAQGNYTIEKIAAGSYTIRANKTEYVEMTSQIAVENGKTKTQNIVMVTTWGNVTGKVTD